MLFACDAQDSPQQSLVQPDGAMVLQCKTCLARDQECVLLEASQLHLAQVVQNPPLLSPCVCEENLREIWILAHLCP